MLKQIPNVLTSLNLLCGCIALLFVISGNLVTATVFACLGIFFDFFDGFAARLFNAHSEVGLQLDSLADMVTSGLVPGFAMVQLLSKSYTGDYFKIDQLFAASGISANLNSWLPLVGLLVVVASAYRLAKFNVDDRQTDSFIGLPTPANTLLILSLVLILEFQNVVWVNELILSPWFLIGLTIISSVLLNAEIPLFALKFKTWDVKSNLKRYVFLAFCLLALLTLRFLGLPVIIAVYVLLSLVWKEQTKLKV
ncbi:MAG: CDP-alcohol phosphatidyltransferase family protein [Flavobacteriaceae bacterium]|nr:CDP-alcohol phosphatidyltransferase family protein [Flavobacteriaceae bacterium]